MYNVEALQRGIRHAKLNIKELERAIENERKNIADWKIMIDSIERAEKDKAEAEKNVTVEIVKEE